MQASQAFIINYLWPIMIVVFACVILKEKITIRKILAIALSFFGVIIVATNGNFSDFGNVNFVGVISCICAAASYGLFSVLNKREGYDKFVSMMLFYLVAFILSLILNLILGSVFVPSVGQLLGLSWIGIFTSAIAFTSWSIALDNDETAKISNLAYITPFLSLIWTTLILREEFSVFSLIGLSFIVIGIFIQSFKVKKTKKQ